MLLKIYAYNKLIFRQWCEYAIRITIKKKKKKETKVRQRDISCTYCNYFFVLTFNVLTLLDRKREKKTIEQMLLSQTYL